MRGGEIIRVPGDSSARVNWKNFPVIVLFVAVLILLSTTKGRTNLIVARVVAGITCVFVARIILLLVVVAIRLIRLKRHPALRVGHLVADGQAAEALSLGRKLLEQSPDDPLVRMNVTAALNAAGQREDAGRVFDEIAPERLPRYLRPAYDNWRRVLGKS